MEPLFFVLDDPTKPCALVAVADPKVHVFAASDAAVAEVDEFVRGAFRSDDEALPHGWHSICRAAAWDYLEGVAPWLSPGLLELVKPAPAA